MTHQALVYKGNYTTQSTLPHSHLYGRHLASHGMARSVYIINTSELFPVSDHVLFGTSPVLPCQREEIQDKFRHSSHMGLIGQRVDVQSVSSMWFFAVQARQLRDVPILDRRECA